MLDKVVLSSDKKRALVVTDDKSYYLNSDTDVIKLVEEFVTEPIARAERCDEITQVIEINPYKECA